jgi:hypothetical protein
VSSCVVNLSVSGWGLVYATEVRYNLSYPQKVVVPWMFCYAHK